MFAARGIAVTSSVFFLLYLLLSLAVCCAWRKLNAYSQRFSAKHRADSLFSLRMFPFFAAVAVTTIFTVPSFLLLEPRAIQEPIGGLPLVLGLGGFCVAFFGAVNAGAALFRASRLIASWTNKAYAIDSQTSVPVVRVESFAPALTAAGILQPKVLLSGAAQAVLNETELGTALRHEVAHVKRRDNLKKLLLLFVAFPGMKNLENAWLASTEMAADDAAVTSFSEALDLAAALIKLSKISASPDRHSEHRRSEDYRCEELMTAFAQSPAALMNARVEWLIAWNADQWEDRQVGGILSPRYASVFSVTVTVIAAFAVTYPQLLAQVHEATEWLVK